MERKDQEGPTGRSDFFSNHLRTIAKEHEKLMPKEIPAEIIAKYPTHVAPSSEAIYIEQLGADSIGPYK
jgi:hypothetical protein